MEIILCVTGSVAAIETVKLARELKRQGFEVKAFMSDDACKIIHPNALEFATTQEVVLDLTGKIEHVKYSQSDLILVAPATANVISKFAYKIADNPINSLLITAFGHDTPILMVPSMHDAMFTAIQENVDKLKNEGINFISPKMAEGKAKFPDIDDIVLAVKKETTTQTLKNKKFVITTGATYEAIDEVRGISNRSSGKMGLEVAKEAYIRGADVTVIHGDVKVDIPKLFESHRVLSTLEMTSKMRELVIDADVFVSAAAVSDFSPSKVEGVKMSSSKEYDLKLTPNSKIIDKIKKINPNIFLVGFKAEYDVSDEKIIDSAKKQINRCGTDLVVTNDVSIEGAGFGSDTNQVIFVDDDIEKTDLKTKSEIATLLIDKISDKL